MACVGPSLATVMPVLMSFHVIHVSLVSIFLMRIVTNVPAGTILDSWMDSIVLVRVLQEHWIEYSISLLMKIKNKFNNIDIDLNRNYRSLVQYPKI